MKTIERFLIFAALACVSLPVVAAQINISEAAAISGVNETLLRESVESINEQMSDAKMPEYDPANEVNMAFPRESNWGFGQAFDAYDRLPKEPTWGYETYGLPLTYPVIIFRFYNETLDRGTVVIFNNETMETVLCSDGQIIDFCRDYRGRDNVTVGQTMVLSVSDIESMSEDMLG